MTHRSWHQWSEFVSVLSSASPWVSVSMLILVPPLCLPVSSCYVCPICFLKLNQLFAQNYDDNCTLYHVACMKLWVASVANRIAYIRCLPTGSQLLAYCSRKLRTKPNAAKSERRGRCQATWRRHRQTLTPHRTPPEDNSIYFKMRLRMWVSIRGTCLRRTPPPNSDQRYTTTMAD